MLARLQASGAFIMGRVTIAARIHIQFDLYEVSQGCRKPEDVRSLDVAQALVDTGAKMLSLPKSLIQQLGLQFLQTRPMIDAQGASKVATYGMVNLSVMGRDAPLDVAELPDECPVLIGYIPLEQLDLVVDPVNQRLIGDPFHGGQNLIDMF